MTGSRRFVDLAPAARPPSGGVNDVQVSVIANGGAYTRPPAFTDLRAAVDVLRKMAVVGLVDMFDESLVAAEYFLRPAFPRLHFEYVKQNVAPSLSSNDGDTNVQPEEQLREAIGDVLYGRLQQLNELDYHLIARTKAEVERRFALMPRREERLADFQSRCEVLRRAHLQLASGE